jgi:sulfide:quinone oxidoreductase
MVTVDGPGTGGRGAGRTTHHRIVVVGGGQAGITVASRLRRAGVGDIAIVEPATEHYYQPLWTMVGGGRADVAKSVRPEAAVMPRRVRWIKDRCVAVDPDARAVTTAGGDRIGYDLLVMAAGIQLDWGAVPGLRAALTSPAVASNYDVRLAPKTWQIMRDLRRGTAVFTMPPGPIKCPGAPQKIAYLCADHWRRQRVLGDIRVVLVLPGAGLFGIPAYATVLARAVERYGIEVRFDTEVVSFDAAARQVTLLDTRTGVKDTLDYDAAHVTPPQSAPDWVKHGPLARPGDERGFVEVDEHTLQHARYPDVFALGDVAGTPNAKTGAAVRRQAPIVAAGALAALAGQQPPGRYEGYAACPFTTARNRVLLAEFDYAMSASMTSRRGVPGLDTTRERYSMWLLTRYGLPAAYWTLFLRGLA